MNQNQAVRCEQCGKTYINPGPFIPRAQMGMLRSGLVCVHCGKFYCDTCTTRKLEYEHQEFVCKCSKGMACLDENSRMVKNGFKEIMVLHTG